jgi:hypothetical protein
MAERELPDRIPESWLYMATSESGSPVPDTLSEAPPPGRDDGAELDGVIRQVRERVL